MGLTDVWIFLILSPMDVVVNPLPLQPLTSFAYTLGSKNDTESCPLGVGN